MENFTLVNNEFLRQFEVKHNNSLARIEYAEQERKIFLTKLAIPNEINSPEFEEIFIKKALEFIADKNLKVVPTCFNGKQWKTRILGLLPLVP